MCRLLGYLGPTIQLDRLVCQPEHSLIVQSYQPREMKEAILNADGFGIGWYHPQEDTEPFTYRNIQPIWSDINLPQLARYISSNKILGYVRSATPGQAVDLSNCQPFTYKQIMFVHNGYIDNFRHSLYRELRSRIQDIAYETIKGSTDSEHIFGLLIDELTAGANKENPPRPPFEKGGLKENPPRPPFERGGLKDLKTAILATLKILTELATLHQVKFLANAIVTDGHQLIATRFAKDGPQPTLYWLEDDPNFPEAVIIASEPLFEGKWNLCPEQSIMTVGENGDIQIDFC